MLTQTDLLERAKEGNPQAIADLMNLVLIPKGVTVKAVVKDTWLYLFFTSKHILSQTSICNFVRTGLLNLDTKAIKNVKLQVYSIGQSSPQWVTEIGLYGDPEEPAPSLVDSNDSPTSLSQPLSPSQQNLKVPIGDRKPSTVIRRRKQKKRGPRSRHPLHVITYILWGQFPSRTRYLMALIVGAGAFLVGGVVAIVADSQAGNQSQLGRGSSEETQAFGNQVVQPQKQVPANTLETEAKKYLAKMNQAQRAFYEANGRFASTLEELERSAAVISHSAHYTYRLAVRSETQSILTATPKTEGLRSFAGAVVSVQSASASTAVSSILCESQASSQFPPVIPQVRSGVIQCPADASPISD